MSTISPNPTVSVDCYHCGLPCPEASVPVVEDAPNFCCEGCRTVYEILQDHGLQRYYDLSARPGTAPSTSDPRVASTRFAYLDDEHLQSRLLDFTDGQTASVTLRLPQIHCASCVWLLENLTSLQEGVRSVEVDFLRRQAAFDWDASRLTLRQLVEALARVGYEPEITLGSAAAGRPSADPLIRRVGVAGFCFGNVMLFSLPEYLAGPQGLDTDWQQTFTLLALALALPVLVYCASEFLSGAWRALRRGKITIDVPIAIGIVVLFARSVADVLLATGPGYFDSFTGFVFFLLLGRLFQRSSFVALSFERDYRSYFPLAVTVRRGDDLSTMPVADLQPGHQFVARHGELIPADSRLLSAEGHIDFSYVTGESDLVLRHCGDVVWAGGRVSGAAVELTVVREVSQSYLTRLWNKPSLHASGNQLPESQGIGSNDLSNMANSFSGWFTAAVLVIAVATAVYWLLVDASLAAHAVTSVLIVACPCALALSTPFTTGTAINLLARAGLFLRDGAIVESLGRTSAVVFDKTGTLTSPGQSSVVFDGEALSDAEERQLAALLANSVHPLSRRLLGHLAAGATRPVAGFAEHTGFGLHGVVDGATVHVGSDAWLSMQGVGHMHDHASVEDTAVFIAFDHCCRGKFHIGNVYRSGVPGLLQALSSRWLLYLLSGDNDRERLRLLPMFGDAERLHFCQSPQEKLQFVKNLEATHRVLMVGDGLNDAGALRQSSVGIAVTEDVAAFSPGCDGILQADQLWRLPNFLRFSRMCLYIVVISFVLSLLYNLTGLAFAVTANLSPLVSAVLMPLSSVTIIAFATIATRWAARCAGIRP